VNRTDWPTPPNARVADVTDGVVTIKALLDPASGARWWVLQVEQDGKWTYQILPATTLNAKVTLSDPQAQVDRVVVSAVSRTGIQSVRQSLAIPTPPVEAEAQAHASDAPEAEVPEAEATAEEAVEEVEPSK